MDDLLAFLQAKEQRDALATWLERNHLANVNDSSFALTPRTRRLRIDGTEGEADPHVRPLVAAFLVPRQPLRPLWPASDKSIYAWLASPERKYEPVAGSPAFPGPPHAMHAGIIMEGSDYRAGCHWRRYLAVQRDGIIELGLGGTACMLFEQKQVIFRLTPIVGHIWHLLGFASDLYRHHEVQTPFTLVVAFRQTQDAWLGALARGWREPWDGFRDYRPRCDEPHFLLRHDDVGPALEPDAARSIAREIAYEIEGSWGHGGHNHYARCFCRSDSGEGDFDLASMCR